MAERLGLTHIYTGAGKGKTTAAFGLAVRAAGAGLKVYIYQFIKGRRLCENRIFTRINGVKIGQCGRGCLIKGRPSAKDLQCAGRGLKRARAIIKSAKYDMVILDEINVALELGLVSVADVIDIVRNKPARVELILTGRGCPERLFNYADIVTEMRKIRHPYDRGIKARRGIEY